MRAIRALALGLSIAAGLWAGHAIADYETTNVLMAHAYTPALTQGGVIVIALIEATELDGDDMTKYGASGVTVALQRGTDLWGKIHPPSVPYSIVAWYFPVDELTAISCERLPCSARLTPSVAVELCIDPGQDRGGEAGCTEATWETSSTPNDTLDKVGARAVIMLQEIERHDDEVAVGTYVSATGFITQQGREVLTAAGARLIEHIGPGLLNISDEILVTTQKEGGVYAQDYTPDLGLTTGAYTEIPDSIARLVGLPEIVLRMVLAGVVVGGMLALAYVLGDSLRAASTTLIMPGVLIAIAFAAVISIWYVFAGVSLAATGAYLQLSKRYIPM